MFRRTRWHRADADDSPTRCAAGSTQVVNSQLSDGLPRTPEGKDVAGETVPVTVSSADLVSTLGLEAVADRNPDVIFAGYLPEQETYDKLAAIAPTVATVGEGMVDDWREVTTVAGEIVDKEEDAADAIEGTDSGRGRAVSAENIDMLDVDFWPCGSPAKPRTTCRAGPTCTRWSVVRLRSWTRSPPRPSAPPRC